MPSVRPAPDSPGCTAVPRRNSLAKSVTVRDPNGLPGDGVRRCRLGSAAEHPVERTQAGAAIETHYAATAAEISAGIVGRAERRMEGVACGVAMRGNAVAVQAHGKGALQIGGQAGHS